MLFSLELVCMYRQALKQQNEFLYCSEDLKKSKLNETSHYGFWYCS